MASQEKFYLNNMAIVVRRARRALKLTQKQMAQRLGLSQSVISRIEKAKVGLSAIEWILFCQFTNTSPFAFLSAPPAEESGKLPRKRKRKRARAGSK